MSFLEITANRLGLKVNPGCFTHHVPEVCDQGACGLVILHHAVIIQDLSTAVTKGQRDRESVICTEGQRIFLHLASKTPVSTEDRFWMIIITGFQTDTVLLNRGWRTVYLMNELLGSFTLLRFLLTWKFHRIYSISPSASYPLPHTWSERCVWLFSVSAIDRGARGRGSKSSSYPEITINSAPLTPSCGKSTKVAPHACLFFLSRRFSQNWHRLNANPWLHKSFPALVKHETGSSTHRISQRGCVGGSHLRMMFTYSRLFHRFSPSGIGFAGVNTHLMSLINLFD